MNIANHCKKDTESLTKLCDRDAYPSQCEGTGFSVSDQRHQAWETGWWFQGKNALEGTVAFTLIIYIILLFGWWPPLGSYIFQLARKHQPGNTAADQKGPLTGMNDANHQKQLGVSRMSYPLVLIIAMVTIAFIWRMLYVMCSIMLLLLLLVLTSFDMVTVFSTTIWQ